MQELSSQNHQKLRPGYTSGSCAAAAARAAAWMLLTGQKREEIELLTPRGLLLKLQVLDIQFHPHSVSCAIKKDSGDDPDVTDGLLIYAEVSQKEEEGISIEGGPGVGRVTRRGLDQPVGAAAINSVPRQMIQSNLEEVLNLLDLSCGLSVIISVPGGEAVAKKTFNPRLGIVGGISILGTSGIVDPMSEKALVDTIRVELKQRRALEEDPIILTPGNYGMDFIEAELGIPSTVPVLCSNYVGDSLDSCCELGFHEVLLIGHIGKLVKLAANMMNTHSRYGDGRMEILAAHAAACGLPPEACAQILDAVTCDEALRILGEHRLRDECLKRVMTRISAMLDHRIAGKLRCGAIIFSKNYGLLGKSPDADSILRKIKER